MGGFDFWEMNNFWEVDKWEGWHWSVSSPALSPVPNAGIRGILSVYVRHPQPVSCPSGQKAPVQMGKGGCWGGVKGRSQMACRSSPVQAVGSS